VSITEKTDQEIIVIVNPMIDEVIQASNSKDWKTFCKYQTSEEANDPENKKNVESQWKNSKLLTSLSLQREILGVMRRNDVALVYWKQTSTQIPGEFLASYHVREIDQEIKEVGFLII
jgi:hypothetical protein